MAEYAVELRNVSKRFPGPSGEIVTAVKNVNMQIGDGEFFSMLGPSGCGKTTSLRMIAGFEHPTEGEVYIHGRAMGHTPAFQRPVNTVFQSYALFPHMTIGENVAFGLQMDGVPKADIGPRVKDALTMVRLPGYENRKAQTTFRWATAAGGVGVRWSNGRKCCCLTNRSARSISNCARRCSWS
ncbi:MAG: ATP-binding cassette domain-containing protein [Caldilineaceae bacterium]